MTNLWYASKVKISATVELSEVIEEDVERKQAVSRGEGSA